MSLSPEEIAAGWENAEIGTDLKLETDKMRVWHLRLLPGQSAPPHRHDRPYFWTVLTDGEALSRFDDGREVHVSYKAGEIQNFPDLTRVCDSATAACTLCCNGRAGP